MKWGLRIFFPASLPRMSQPLSGSLLCPTTFWGSCSLHILCTLQDQGGRRSLLCTAPSLLVSPNHGELLLYTVVFTPFNYTMWASHQFPAGTMTDAKSEHSWKDLTIDHMWLRVSWGCVQMDKFKHRKSTRMELRILEALYSVQTCSYIAPKWRHKILVYAWGRGVTTGDEV